VFIQSYLNKPDLANLDGELIVGSPFSKSCFNTTQSGVMSQDGEPNFRYLVFDYIDDSLMFEQRFEILRVKFDTGLTHHYHRVLQVPQRYIYSVEELLRFESRMVAKGWEGIMIRRPDGIYKQGRSTLNEAILIKVKRFQDSEAEILGAYEQETNLNEAHIDETGRNKRSSHKENKVLNGHLGGFFVRDVKTGVEFDIGTFQGVTKDQRFEMWTNFLVEPSKYLGKIIKYKFFPVGVKTKPRHPIMVGFRHEDDCDEIS
jgi:DNA ligase-1